MDEDALLRDILKSILGIAQERGAHYIRVINLSVYDQHYNPDEIALKFQDLASDTLARQARVYVHCRTPHPSDLANDVAPPTAPGIRIDSIELER
jgi:Zn finger protein HypA/HybF involved in hydrogenase expression